VQHYSFDLTLADSTDRIRGEAEVRVRFTTDTLSAVRLDLIGPPSSPEGTGMRVQAVMHDGADLEVQQANNHVRITPATPPTTNAVRTYTIRYAGIPADGLIIGTNQHGERTFFGDNWPNRARHWLPVVDHLADKATVSFSVTAPPRYAVVSNGTLVRDTTRGTTRTTTWRTDEPLPTKVMVVGVADFAVDRVATVADSIPVQSWVYPQDRTEGFRDLGQAPDVVRFFIENLGPFPYEKLANVQSTTRYGGMENATAIFYSEQAVSDGEDDTNLIAHEIAHQWYGNSVTESDWPHLWLSEGFATYLAGLYLEHAQGSAALTRYMERARRRVFAYTRQNPDTPLVDTTYADPAELLTTNPYQKGAWVLHMLRRTVGTDAFWDGLRAYYARYRDGNASTSDFQAVMEDVSGQDLGTFFQQWTRRAGHPSLEGTWRFDADANACIIDLRQTQNGPPFDVAVDVGIMTDGATDGAANGGLVQTLDLTQAQQSFRVDCAASPSQVVLDPNTHLLAEMSMQEAGS
jgi:aminopeptidase N